MNSCTSTCSCARHQCDQRLAGVEHRFGPIDFAGQQLAELRIELAAGEHRFVVAGAAAAFLRQINAATLVIAGHVLPEVGQLQRGADLIGQLAAALVVAAAQIQHQAADGIGRVAAVAEQIVECFVASCGLILAESDQQIAERIDREFRIREWWIAAPRTPDAWRLPR